MRLTHFFVERPIFATVIAIVITLVGAFSYPLLPVAQFPQIAPPTINVSVTYPGASAEVVSETVLAPLEQQINGVKQLVQAAIEFGVPPVNVDQPATQPPTRMPAGILGGAQAEEVADFVARVAGQG